VDAVLHKLVSSSQQLGGDENNRRGAIAYFLILLLCQIHKNLSGGVFDIEKAQNRGAVVCDGNILFIAMCEGHGTASLQVKHWISYSYTNVIHHHLIETTRAEGALDDICDCLGSENWPKD
jgi:hypothetical protein